MESISQVTGNVTWPQVAMTLVLMIPSLTVAIIGAIATYRAACKAVDAGKAAAVTAGEGIRAIKDVKADLAGNSIQTAQTLASVGLSADQLSEIKRLVNGERERLLTRLSEFEARDAERSKHYPIPPN